MTPECGDREASASFAMFYVAHVFVARLKHGICAGVRIFYDATARIKNLINQKFASENEVEYFKASAVRRRRMSLTAERELQARLLLTLIFNDAIFVRGLVRLMPSLDHRLGKTLSVDVCCCQII